MHDIGNLLNIFEAASCKNLIHCIVYSAKYNICTCMFKVHDIVWLYMQVIFFNILNCYYRSEDATQCARSASGVC